MAINTNLYKIHAVIIHKSPTMKFPTAKMHARNILKRDAPYDINESSWRFDSIPKEEFNEDSFRTKVVNDDISLVFGKLKKGLIKKYNDYP